MCLCVCEVIKWNAFVIGPIRNIKCWITRHEEEDTYAGLINIEADWRKTIQIREKCSRARRNIFDESLADGEVPRNMSFYGSLLEINLYWSARVGSSKVN